MAETLNTTTAAFIAPALSSGSITGSTAVSVQARVPFATTLNAMSLHLTANLAGGGTLTIRPTINGVDNSGLSCVVSSGSSNATVTGSASVAQDDLLCFHAIFAGGSTTATMFSLTVAYTSPAVGSSARFMTFRRADSNDLRGEVFSNDTSPDGINDMRMISPRAFKVFEQTLAVPIAPTGGQTYESLFVLDTTTLGTVTITAGNLSARQSSSSGLSVPIGTISPPTAATQFYNDPGSGGGAAVQTLNQGYAYRCALPDEDVCLFGLGSDGRNVTLAGTNRFMTFGRSGTAVANATETNVQVRWPIAGTFKFFYVQYNSAAGGNVTLAFRVNALDSAAVWALPAGQAFRDYSTQVTVAAGDLLSFRFIRTAGAGTVFQPMIICGFSRAT